MWEWYDKLPSCGRMRRYGISSARLAVKLALLFWELCAHALVSTVDDCAHVQTCSAASMLLIFHRTFIHHLWLVVQEGPCRLMRACSDIARWIHIFTNITCETYNKSFLSIVLFFYFSTTVAEFPSRDAAMHQWVFVVVALDYHSLRQLSHCGASYSMPLLPWECCSAGDRKNTGDIA